MTIIIRVGVLGCCQVETHDLKKRGGKQQKRIKHRAGDEISLINEQPLFSVFALFHKSWAHGVCVPKGEHSFLMGTSLHFRIYERIKQLWKTVCVCVYVFSKIWKTVTEGIRRGC